MDSDTKTGMWAVITTMLIFLFLTLLATIPLVVTALLIKWLFF